MLIPGFKHDISNYILNNYSPLPETGCWIWLGGWDRFKYGIVSRNMRYVGLAHRVFYAAFNGAIPIGMEVCHKCDVPSCVNPGHLFLGTHLQNMQDMVAKRRHRPNGKSQVLGR